MVKSLMGEILATCLVGRWCVFIFLFYWEEEDDELRERYR